MLYSIPCHVGCFLKFRVIANASPVATVIGHELFEYSN